MLHFALNVAGAKETINVSATPDSAPTDSSTPTTVVDRLEIARTPGAARSNSMAMITDFVPGAYITHDQLHIRGGHQTSWLVDGVPVPNTNIATNLGPQFDPKDIDYLEVSRGGYGAEFGDRTYGVFNVVPRTGFERNSQAELVLSAGNFYQTNDQFSIGSHTERFAYYASVNGNRSNLGIETPVPQVVHDAANGYGGFGSLIFNVDPSNQLRFVTSLRKDYYQIPYDPHFPTTLRTTIPPSGSIPASNLRDADHESDARREFLLGSHFQLQTAAHGFALLSLQPRELRQRAHRHPNATTEHRGSTYAGGQVSFSANLPRNNLQVGFYGFYQSDHRTTRRHLQLHGQCDRTFQAAGPRLRREHPSGSRLRFVSRRQIQAFLLADALRRPSPDVFLRRSFTESSISPRFGVALNVPRLNWTFRASYGHYYQAPPLLTASGPLLEFVNSSNLDFIALHGERDEEAQFGVNIPWRGWVLDADMFRTNASQLFRPQQCRRVESLFPADHSERHRARMGTYPALPPHCALRARFISPIPIRWPGPEGSSTVA